MFAQFSHRSEQSPEQENRRASYEEFFGDLTDNKIVLMLGENRSSGSLFAKLSDEKSDGGYMLTRRDVLRKCVALGSVLVASHFSSESLLAALQEREKQVRKPTPPNTLGPFYKRLTPLNSVLRLPGDTGMPLTLSGQVFDTRGDIVPDATIEIWQTNHQGYYDLDGYRYRGKVQVDRSGAYSFESVIPGHYPDKSRVCQHVHYVVSAPGHKTLVTQLYFATDPVFEGDPVKNYGRDPLIQTPELIRPVMLTGDPNEVHAKVQFEQCLERL
jgi:protocatechuate 3,4-dioxygenase beta subunit